MNDFELPDLHEIKTQMFHVSEILYNALLADYPTNNTDFFKEFLHWTIQNECLKNAESEYIERYQRKYFGFELPPKDKNPVIYKELIKLFRKLNMKRKELHTKKNIKF